MADNLPQKSKQLPTLQELHYDVETAFKNDQLKLLLNQKPQAAWLKKHPLATKKVTDSLGTREVPAEYLPIDKVEFMMDRIFQEWRVEVLREGVMFHSIYVTVRVHYKNPVTGEWSYHDGVGGVKAQSDAKATFGSDSIKASAVQIGLPAAKSYAIKDACEHLGDLFGRNVNRAETIAFQGAYQDIRPARPTDKSNERLEALMRSCSSKKELEKFKENLETTDHRMLYDELYKQLK